MATYKYLQTVDAYAGKAQSAETSNYFFTGDASMVAYSLATSSTTASRWTAMGNGSDGFFSALDATAWQPINAVANQGYYSLATIPRWLAFQRTASASSSTIQLSIYVGI